jgi:hypothetical protein
VSESRHVRIVFFVGLLGLFFACRSSACAALKEPSHSFSADGLGGRLLKFSGTAKLAQNRIDSSHEIAALSRENQVAPRYDWVLKPIIRPDDLLVVEKIYKFYPTGLSPPL